MSIRIDKDCRYTKSHEWIRPMKGTAARLGITDYAQDQLSDIVYVELPEIGDKFKKGDSFAVAESVKATSDCYMPVGGEITAVNDDLANAPASVNEDPYVAGWFVEISMSNPSELNDLMGPEAYESFCAEEAAKGGH
jgi:glycine cleavage system H protein